MALPASDCCAIVALLTSLQAPKKSYKAYFVMITRFLRNVLSEMLSSMMTVLLSLSSAAEQHEALCRQVQQS
jgi:hypothetical protein